ncbi:MAG: diguanylate cyclase [Pseudomonadota bacterium]
MSKIAQRTRVQRRIDPDIADLRGFAASVGQVSVLMCVLLMFYLFFGEVPTLRRDLFVGLVVVYAIVALAVRYGPLFANRRLRTRLAVEAVLMVLFVTILATLTGGVGSPLVALYLLPLVVAGIVLGQVATLWMLALVFVAFVAVGTWQDGRPTMPSVASAAALLLQFAPMLLITYLTMLLAMNFRSTRRQITALSERDDLTELYNMRAFVDRLDEVHALAVRHEEPYGIVMIDVDALKPINDEFGHEAGNRAIVLVARAIQRCTRGSDISARYGGDEFIVLLPHSAKDESEAAIRRIRNSIFATTLKAGPKMVRISVSIGLATFPKDGTDPTALMNAADKAMYLDKAHRRERDREPAALKDSQHKPHRA